MLSWFRGPSKADPETKIWGQILSHVWEVAPERMVSEWESQRGK